MSRLGPYTILRRLAVGGMAEVFLARRDGPAGVAKVVALKRILPHLSDSPDFVSMFLDEARIASQLSHPNIVQLHDFGEVDGTQFLAMEYVQGEDLLTILRRCKECGVVVPPAIVATILAAACEGLHYAHELRGANDRPLGLVHRDVSPSNLMVSYDGVVKVADFGIAKVQREAAATTGSHKGKAPYMSPEQALARRLDRRSDLFSLGIVGHELLTGARLFQRDSDYLVLHAITEEPIESPRAKQPDLSPALDGIIMRALERDPTDRFASAQAMQLELEKYLAEQGGVGLRLALSKFLHELFGDEAAAARRRWAVGETDDEVPTRTLVSVADEAKPRAKSRRRAVIAMAVVGAAAVGVGGLAVWRARGNGSDERARVAASSPPPRVVAPPGTPPDAPPPMTPPADAAAVAAVPEPALVPEAAVHETSRPSGPAATSSSYLSVDRGVALEATLDGRSVGTTPIVHLKIKPGAHTLTLRAPDDHRLVTKFRVSAGKEYEDKRPVGLGNLTCDVVPWADVYLGTRKLGTTPLASVSLSEGTYTLRVSNPDLRREQTVQVTIRPGETTRVKTTLATDKPR